MTTPLRLLIVEDSEDDALLLERELIKNGYDLECDRVDTPEAMQRALAAKAWDIVISDFVMPRFSGLDALRTLKESGIGIPFIIVSGKIGEETAVEAMRAGANDYIIKGNLARLAPAVEREMADAEVRRKRRQAEDALRESEERFRNLFERHSAVKLIIEPEMGNIIDANAAAEQFYGWPIEKLKQMRIQQINVLPTGTVKSEMEKAASPESSGFEFRHRRSDGSIRDVEVFSNKIELAGKSLLYSIIHDITARKRVETENAQLEVLNLQLQKAESLGRMAGAIAHHFNNMLGAVIGNLELAVMDLPPGSDALNNLTQAIKASHRAAEVSSLMLTYLGQTPGKHEPMDLSENCHMGLSMLRAVIPKKVIVKPELPSPGPTIRANTNQMQQILANLVTNAWESIGDNPGNIRLTVKTVSPAEISASHRFPIDWQPQDQPYACLEVMDTGCGITDKDIEKIFDPFFTTKFTGRGLGLPVVLGIVGAHGGGVTVESEPGRGSVFCVFLPLSAEETLLQQEKTVPASKFEGGGTVLVVEDEEQLRDMVKMMLIRLSFNVLEAKDGVDAVEIFQQHQDEICCVLSDLTMPRMDGWETLAALRKLSPDIPVILSSGYDEARVMAGEHPERPNAFLGKPYQLKGLSDTINRVLSCN